MLISLLGTHGTHYLYFFQILCSGGSKGARGMRAPRGPNSFNFMQFLGKFAKNRMLAPPGWLASPPTENPGSATAMADNCLFLGILIWSNFHWSHLDCCVSIDLVFFGANSTQTISGRFL